MPTESMRADFQGQNTTKPTNDDILTPIAGADEVQKSESHLATGSSRPENHQPEQVGRAAEHETSTFDQLGLDDRVAEAVSASGYSHPTPIQSKIIPHMLAGRDVLAQSQTGSGKTAAFALPILSRLNKSQGSPQVLVLAPTRELAIQVAKSFSTYASSLPDFRVAAIYGGQDYEPQLKQLRRGVHVVVGTPGRVIDHIKRGTLNLDGLECLVLDEADEMLNMGFLEDVEFILEQSPAERQIALFSATLPEAIRKISQRYLNDPAKITIKKKTVTADSIRQRVLFIAPRLKLEVLKRFLEVEETDGVIVFTKTKDATISVAEKLSRAGFSTVALNGDMPQKVRERAIENLKAERIDVLVATDVAARGLDVTRISHVINFDLPHDSESYIHRIGRTGRAGRKGEAILLLSNAQRGKLKLIERATKQKIEIIEPPSTDAINEHRVENFKQSIAKTIAGQDLAMFEELVRGCEQESGASMYQIAAALAHLAQNGRPFLAKELPAAPPRSAGGPETNRKGRREFGSPAEGREKRPPLKKLGPPKPGMKRYRLEVGRKDRVKPGNIVGAIANEGGIDGEFIGPLRIFDTFTIVDLPEGMPREIYQTLQKTRVAGKPLRLREDDGGPNRKEIAARGGKFNRPHRKFEGPRSKSFKGKPKGAFKGPKKKSKKG